MFHVEGYLNAYRLRNAFKVRNLKADLRRAIVLWQKHDILRRRIITSDAYRQETDSEARKEMVSRSALTVKRLDAEVKDYEAYESMDYREETAFRTYLRDLPLFLNGPSGVLVPVTKDILSRNPGHPKNDSGYHYLSDQHLAVCAVERLKVIEAVKVIQRQAWLIDPSTHVSAMFNTFLDLEAAFKSLVPFEGFYLAVKQPAAPTDEQLWDSFGFELAKGEDAQEAPRKGRPRKQEHARRLYLERFPDGHGSYTWPEVTRILEVEYGFIVSEDTLREAIKSREKD